MIDFMETVHVQLSDERGDIGMFKVLAQRLGELFIRVDKEI